MSRIAMSIIIGLFAGLAARADDVVFKSDVALSRVDAQVVDHNGHNVTGLEANDFVLRVNGKVVPIRNFASENMPIDILLLLDVSGSMEPHVERIALAAQQALNVLGEKDRVAVMVFDTSTRVRLPFRGDHAEINRALRQVIRSEGFNGGTRITSAMIAAASYLGREARPDARRAIVILTDDETQDGEDEPRVEGALARANAVLSFLRAPYEPPTGYPAGHRRGGTWGSGPGMGIPGGGTGWPGGGGIGFPGGGGPMGRRGPGGYGGADRSHTAGTATVAQDSGGDTMQVDDASSLQDTLMRLRQRYALNFYVPEGVSSGTETVKVDLSDQGRLGYYDADVHYRRVFMSGAANARSAPTLVTHAPESVSSPPEGLSPRQQSAHTEEQSQPAATHHSAAVNEDSAGPHVNMLGDEPGRSTSGSNSSPSGSTSTSSSQQAPKPPATPATGTGWPRVKPPDQPDLR